MQRFLGRVTPEARSLVARSRRSQGEDERGAAGGRTRSGIYEISSKKKFMCQWRIPLGIRGFTLVEVIVSMVILALLASGLFGTMVASRSLIARSKTRLTAVQIAQREIENKRQFVRADTWDLNNSSNPLNPTGCWSAWDNTTYNPYHVRYRVESVTGMDCRRVTVEVRWNETTNI